MKSLVLFLVAAVASLAAANPPWSANVMAADAGDTINEGESCIASDGDYIYCISNCNERSTYAVIPYGRSTDGGATWATQALNDPTRNYWHTDPVLLTDDTGYVHMFIQFSTDIIKHYLSTDHGVTWTDTSEVSDLGTGGDVDKPWACSYGRYIYVSWQEISGAQEGMRFARSSDGGRTWTRQTVDPTRTGIAGICTSPSGIVYLMNRYWGGDEVVCTRSTDNGSTWAPWVTIDQNCSYNTGYGDRAPLPSIAAPTDDDVVITWVDDRSGNWDILYTRSSDGGATWTTATALHDSIAGGQCKGWVTSDPYGGLHFVWYHTPSWPTSSSSRWSIRYAHSDDYGATIQPSIRLTDTTFTSPVTFIGEYHIIVTDSVYARCVWADGRDGDLDLYFAQALLSQIGVEENPWQVTRVAGLGLDVAAVLSGPAIPVGYTLKRPGSVSVAVFNSAGRQLTSRQLGNHQPGSYRELLNDLPAGQPLFVRLVAGSETVTAKTILVP